MMKTLLDAVLHKVYKVSPNWATYKLNNFIRESGEFRTLCISMLLLTVVDVSVLQKSNCCKLLSITIRYMLSWPFKLIQTSGLYAHDKNIVELLSRCQPSMLCLQTPPTDHTNSAYIKFCKSRKIAHPQDQSVHQFVNACSFKCRPSTVLHQFGLQPCWMGKSISVERT